MEVDPSKKKRTWSELRGVVSDLRRQLSSLCPMAPSSITFRTLEDGRTRIYFLSTLQNGCETTLLFSDVPNTNQPNSLRLQWQSVIESNFPCLSSTGKSSREEQLLWERKRIATWGINSYESHANSGKIVFSAAGNLFQCVDDGVSCGQLFPERLRGIKCKGAKISPQICPSNPDLVAYVCNYDIWVTHTVSGCNARITFASNGVRSLAGNPLSAGIPSYVMQEEFCRYQGYWWQPTSKDGVYQILYEEVDDSDVQLFSFPSSQSEIGDVEEFRFPRAGCSNSRSNLKIVEFRVDQNSKVIDDIRVLQLQMSLSMMFPSMEYLVRFGWTPDSRYVWLQLLDRRQQHLEVVLLSVDNFMDLFSSDTKEISKVNPVIQVIYVQKNSVWINVHNLLYFLPSDKHNEVKFIWANEDTGYRHLYFITTQIHVSNNGLMETSQSMDFVFTSPKISSQVPLTAGEWEVLGENIWVDEQKQLVYFIGLRETPLEKHLYVVSLKRPGEIRMLSRPGYSYSVNINKECSMVTTVYSNTHKPSACQVFRIDHSDWTVEGITLTPLGYLLEPCSIVNEYFCPDLHKHIINSGDVLYAMVFKPHNYEPGKKYPTILNVYGGPEVQLVNNTFKGMRQLRMHMLAMCGYCVVAIDSRGSQHRGLQFESYIKRRMGTVEMKDQIEVLNHLVEILGYIDVDRLAILGWSYGGYMSLMGLVQYPNLFKIAVAGAPVTNWNLYDTGYTERYMDLPTNNPDGYMEGSVLNYINKFPDEENRLLIIHGLIDENVHFYHTSQLVNNLIKAGKPYQLQIYPGERHSLRHLDASKHYETSLLSFLQNNL